MLNEVEALVTTTVSKSFTCSARVSPDSFLSVSLPSSAKQQREMSAVPLALAVHNSFVLEGLPHLCQVKMLGIVAKRLQ